MRLHYIPVMAISLFLNRISLEGDSRGSAMTNNKKLIDVTASPGQICHSFTNENEYQT